MSHRRSRQFVTLLLVFGALVFGLVLAGGIEITTPGIAAPEPQSAAAPPAQERAPAAPPIVGGLPSFADLAETVSPSVVSIEARSFRRVGEGGPRGRPTDPFEFFFGPRRRDAPQPDDQEFRSDSGGSGFVISADGLVATNNHVVRGAEELKVHLGENTFDAEIVGTDSATDLALLKIDAGQNLVPLPLGDSNGLRVGEWVMAVGSPLGLTDTVTVGVVSAKERRIFISSDSSFENFIQTDAAINFGNSGGPLINLRGEVVGINTAINFNSENIGFAVPVNTLKQILPQLRETGRVRRGFLGIGVRDLDRNAAEAFGLSSTAGSMVTNVQPGLPADRAGLKHGDIIVKVDGRPLENTRELIDHVSAKGPDETVTLEVLREGESLTKKVTLAERPTEEAETEPTPGGGSGGIEWLGLRYQDLTPGLRSMHGLPEDLLGVWITAVSPRSPLYDEGLRSGPLISVITEVNGRPVRNVEEFEGIVRGAEAGSRLRLYVRRFDRGQEGQPIYVFPAVPSG